MVRRCGMTIFLIIFAACLVTGALGYLLGKQEAQ
jgi:hypothetical protein